MSYATALELLHRHGNNGIAEMASTNSDVDGQLLLLSITEGDRSAYDSSSVAAADEAVIRIQLVMSDAQNRMDSYLRERYTLPLTAEQVEKSDLSRIQTTLARYFLIENDPSETVLKRYQDAIAWLRDVSVGKASLGEQDETVSTGGNSAVRTIKKRIDWNSY